MFIKALVILLLLVQNADKGPPLYTLRGPVTFPRVLEITLMKCWSKKSWPNMKELSGLPSWDQPFKWTGCRHPVQKEGPWEYCLEVLMSCHLWSRLDNINEDALCIVELTRWGYLWAYLVTSWCKDLWLFTHSSCYNKFIPHHWIMRESRPKHLGGLAIRDREYYSPNSV